MGQKAKHDDDDRISNLPDSILSCILCWLPIKDAVSTSILSTRWRYLFASMFNINVDIHLFRLCPVHTVMSFTNFMDKLLFLHAEGRIERFRLHHIDISGIDASRVLGWLCAALWRGVKEMDLVLAPNSQLKPLLMPELLYTSKTLVRLNLEFPHVLIVPIHVCLPCLKTLNLKILKFVDGGSLTRLISSCPVLEDLTIFNCVMGNITCLEISNPSLQSLTLIFRWFPSEFTGFCFKFDIVINVPSLVYFTYSGFIAKSYSIVNMPSLVRADIGIYGGCNIRESDGLVQFFKIIGNVKSLHMSLLPDPLPYWSQHLTAVPNQFIETLYRMNTLERMGLFKFLQFSPNLQTLVICKVPNEFSFPVEEVPSCLVYQLKEIQLQGFDDESSFFKLITFILKHSIVLEKLTICTSQVMRIEEELKFTKQLLRLPRSSTKCQVVVI